MREGATSAGATWPKWTASQQIFAKRLLLAIAVAVMLFQWGRLCVKPRGDFVRHWEFGRRFVAREFLYSNGLDVPYLPFWAMAHAPLTLLPLSVVQPLLYPFCMGSIVVLFLILDRLTHKHLHVPKDSLFWISAAVLICVSRYVIRDLDEAGSNLPLLTLTWLSVYYWINRRDFLGGVCLGLAIALKCTPALLLAYLTWKRQWKFAAATIVSAASLTLAPALWQGRTEYMRHLETWVTHLKRGMPVTNPALGVLGEEPVKNQSLRAALGRYLIRMPPGHAGHVDHSWYGSFLDLPPVVASMVTSGVTALLLLIAGLLFRGPVRQRGEVDSLWECSAVSIMMLLLSPITWGQHCVAVIPAVYLIARTAVAHGGLPRWILWTLGVVVFLTLGLNRTFVGRELALILDSYGTTTFSLLLVLAVVVRLRAQAVTESCSSTIGLADRSQDG